MTSQDFSDLKSTSGINTDFDNDTMDDTDEYAATSISSVNSSAIRRDKGSDLFTLGLFSETEISNTEKITNCTSCR